eukprot:GFYU01009352.1.p1 GENE.GFYU01009352.1~~GFYU01009352.1.p1  ORF type:complete len:161 (-),score=44.57 GFYU01009352.1:550-1032(-)
MGSTESSQKPDNARREEVFVVNVSPKLMQQMGPVGGKAVVPAQAKQENMLTEAQWKKREQELIESLTSKAKNPMALDTSASISQSKQQEIQAQVAELHAKSYRAPMSEVRCGAQRQGLVECLKANESNPTVCRTQVHAFCNCANFVRKAHIDATKAVNRQ